MRTIAKKEISFGKVAYYGTRKINELVVELEITDRNTYQIVDGAFKPTDHNLTFSVDGSIYNSKHTDILCGGQCYDEINMLIPNNELWQRIKKVWHNHYLKHIADIPKTDLDEILDLMGIKYSDLQK